MTLKLRICEGEVRTRRPRGVEVQANRFNVPVSPDDGWFMGLPDVPQHEILEN
jgi:hypothetical protein